MATAAPVPTVPRIQVFQNHGFFLTPQGATGVEAIVYLPVYNAALRQKQERDGLKLLSTVRGELTGGGDDKLVIEPPSDDMIRYVITELERRQEAERERMQLEAREIQDALDAKEYEGKERTLYATRRRQLEARARNLAAGIPSFTRLKRYFVNEHRIRLVQEIPASTRRALESINVEQQWQTLSEDLTSEMEGKPARAKAPAKAKSDAELVGA